MYQKNKKDVKWQKLRLSQFLESIKYSVDSMGEWLNKKIFCLEDLEAWKEARKLAKMLFDLSKKLPPEEKFTLKAHINGNGRHIPANIAEGFGRFYAKDSIQFYRVALGSLNEVKSDLYLCLDRNYTLIKN